MQSRQLILIALYVPHSTCQLFQTAKAFREVKTVCMHLLSSKETAIPIWHLQGLNEFAPRRHTNTNILSISLSSKQNMTDWQTDCAGNRLTDRQTDTCSPNRQGKQTDSDMHTFKNRGRIATCAHVCTRFGMYMRFMRKIKNVTVLIIIFFLFPQSQSPSTAV